jgi:hypothetical protein
MTPYYEQDGITLFHADARGGPAHAGINRTRTARQSHLSDDGLFLPLYWSRIPVPSHSRAPTPKGFGTRSPVLDWHLSYDQEQLSLHRSTELLTCDRPARRLWQDDTPVSTSLSWRVRVALVRLPRRP